MSSILFDQKNLFLKGKENLSRKKLLEKDGFLNIFEVLSLESKEVIHSKFIYELLDSNGKNSLNKIFLKLFFENVLKNESFRDEGFYNIYREYTIENGRLDFYIKDIINNYGIGIEMKIYADDQNKQLKKYNDFLKNEHGDNYSLYYLTIEGLDASEYSTLGTSYKKISFKNHISIWIKKCLEKSTDNFKLNEILKQYLYIINKISNNLEDEEKMELKDLLLEDKNLRIAEKMQNVIPELKNEIEDKFWKDLREQIIVELHFKDIPKLITFQKYDYNQRDIYFFKEMESFPTALLEFGLGRNCNGVLFFFIGVIDKITDEWITQNCDDNLKNNLNSIASNFEVDSYVEYINGFNFKTEDFYILLEEDKKSIKDSFIKNLIEMFKIKYEVIKKLF
ncbi:MAG: PD-(D/E)XK nuclease family protein [Cetobacterium sp.]